MYIRTYFDKDNTIIKDSLQNLGSEGVSNLFFGGNSLNPNYSRYIFHFDESHLVDLYQNCRLGNLDNVTHKLIFTPTFYYNGSSLCPAKSFELCLFRLNQKWNEGCGLNPYKNCTASFIQEQSNSPSNWIYAEDNVEWNENGVYTTISGNTIVDCKPFGCNSTAIEFDVTEETNEIITSQIDNYGYGLAFSTELENTITAISQHLGLYTKDTDFYFEPYLETYYTNPIKDNRKSFHLGKSNNLYLSVSILGDLRSLDESPIVTIIDSNENVIEQTTGVCVDQGVYCAEFTITGSTEDCSLWDDVWSNLIVDGVELDNVTNIIQPLSQYTIKNNFFNGRSNYNIRFSGIKSNERIISDSIRRIGINVYEPYNNYSKVIVGGLKYQITIKDGLDTYNICDWIEVNTIDCQNWFNLDTSWMIPFEYFISLKLEQNGEVHLYEDIIKFKIEKQ